MLSLCWLVSTRDPVLPLILFFSSYFKNWQVTMKSKYWQWMEQLIKKKKKREKKMNWTSWISQKRIICRSCGFGSSEYNVEISCRYMITRFKYLNISIVIWQFNHYQNTQKIQRQDVYRWIIWSIISTKESEY